MTDYFALLGFSRRPWLDADALKDRFHQLATQHHPDASGETDAFAQLNHAYGVLREPAARLRHLLELEYTTESGGGVNIPAQLTERFMEVATLQREVHVFLQQQASTTSAIARSLLAGERFAMQRDLEMLIKELASDIDRLQQLLRVEDSLWEQRDAETPGRLAELQQEFAFLSKWTDQLRERLLQLEANAQ